jgi:hypothetical protein
MNKCALVRAHIRANPGCTYQQIAAGIGIPSNKWLKDVRKMVARGLIVCEEREGVRYHTLGREPSKVIGLTREEHAQRKREARKRYVTSPKGREKRNARRRKGAGPGPGTPVHRSQRNPAWNYSIAAPAPTVRAQTVEDFIAAGGVIERLPGPWDRVAA